VKFKLVVRPEVDADLLEAERWYEQQQAGLGRDFLRAARETMASLPRNPFLYRIRQHRRQVRWAYPLRFPCYLCNSARCEAGPALETPAMKT